MATARVMAQIRDATTQGQTSEVALTQRSAWASQPGAIHVYSSEGQTVYKLYSSDLMRTTNPNLSADVPADWYEQKSAYTDLNEPVDTESGWQFPILDPGVTAMVEADSVGIQEGFRIEDTAPVEPEAANAGFNPAPMPVRWLYILEDGTHCLLGDSRIDRVNNPIVGRIAFWADDETAKVNFNTASPATDSSYWDAPRANSSPDRSRFSNRQPSQNEYNRYPGHPAMISLRSILGGLGGISPEQYYALTPRYRWGGSKDGTTLISQPRVSLLNNKEDRRYATLDEVLLTSQTSSLQPGLNPETFSALRFFLTTSSRSPELNLFGQPRISLWPIFGNPDSPDPGNTRRTHYDQMSAFSSTVAGKPYYLARENSLSPTHDYATIPRNRQIYAYLQRLTSAPVPGYGPGTFEGKYDKDRDRILTAMLDYIRIVNLNETYFGREPGFVSYTTDWKVDHKEGSTTAMYDGNAYNVGNSVEGAGMVVPIEIGDTRGIGRFPVITEVGLLFVRHAKAKPNGTSVPEAPHPTNPEQLECMVVIETLTPAFGYMPWVGKDLYFDIVACDLQIQVGSRSSDLLPSAVLGENPRSVYYPSLIHGGMTPGGYDGAAYIQGQRPHWVGGSRSDLIPYPYLSQPLDLVPGDTTFSVAGGTMQINLRVGSTVVQTYTLSFENMVDVPLPIRSEEDYTTSFTWNIGRPWWSRRFQEGPFDGDVLHSIHLRHGDARLIAAKKAVPASDFVGHQNYGKPVPFAHGMTITPANAPAELWNGGTVGKFVDLALYSSPITSDSRRSGRRRVNLQKVPAEVKSLRDEGWSGDFDNGWTRFPDGPFINKPDEGMMHQSSTGSYTATAVPYVDVQWSLADGLFSPLRQIPSAVMFGSLPTGVEADKPWRTLLFNPSPADSAHIGFSDPPDHLFLDLFRMPVIEPFAISGPLSTDGKINMNYAIAPFSYIHRASAWYALLETSGFFAVPDELSDSYKGMDQSGSYGVSPDSFRYKVDATETLRQFEVRFSANRLFRSPGEICSLYLVAEGEKLEEMPTFWNRHRLTGDNSREKPYAELYPKVTTQSNTYRVHFRVQLLPRSSGPPSEGADYIPIAEYRGSQLVERYLAPDHPGLASPFDADEQSLNEFYQYRVMEHRQFAP